MRSCFVFLVASVAALSFSNGASAAPLANQIVPIAEYLGVPESFGLAYDPINGVIWSKGNNGSTTLHGMRAFNTFTPVELAGFANGANGKIIPFGSGFSGLTTPAPTSRLNALGYNVNNNQLYMHTGSAPGRFFSFDPITGGSLTAQLIPTAQFPGSISFMDGLDIDAAGNYYYSAEGRASGEDSQFNLSTFLDDNNAAQTDISAVSVIGNTITRWAGIEEIGNRVFAVSEVNNGAGRTIASYDLTGVLLAVDPDGSPFASRLEDLAFDGRFLYGSDFGRDKIFVFDIVGPGGITPIPEPGSVAVWSLSLLALGAWRRRRARKA